MTTHAPLRSQGTKAKPVCHVRGLGDGDAPTSPIKIQGKYIVCMPMRRGDEVTHDVLQRPGRFQQVAENWRVKEVVVGEGERRRRYVVCHNPYEETRQRAHRRQILRELEAELASLKEVRGESQGIRVKRDSAVSVRYSERVNSRKSSYSLQRTDRYNGIVGQKCCHYQFDS